MPKGNERGDHTGFPEDSDNPDLRNARKEFRNIASHFKLDESVWSGQSRVNNAYISLNPRFRTKLAEPRTISWLEKVVWVWPWEHRSRTYYDQESIADYSSGLLWKFGNTNLQHVDQDDPNIGLIKYFKDRFRGSDVGGPMLHLVRQIKFNKVGFVKDPSPYAVYSGAIHLTGKVLYENTGPEFPPDIVINPTPLSELNAFGATAISRVAPTNPTAGLSTFLLELKEGLPSIPVLMSFKDKTHNLRQKGGSEYLNVEFGWRPMIADLHDMAKSVSNARHVFEQFLADSGKKIRRSYVFPEEKTTRTYENQKMFTGSEQSGYGQLSGTVTDVETIERWFSGAFRYHLPNGTSALDRMKLYESQINHLLGTRITPAVLWNVAPWSWMLDWFGNIGDVVQNISNLGQDGMVMQYGYMMERKTIVRTLIANSPGGLLETVITVKTERRVAATPYGFGLTYDGLSLRQKAILAALGLSWGAPVRKSSF